MYLHHFISTDAAITIDIIEVKRPDNLRTKILIEKFFCEKEEVPLVKTSPLLCQYNTTQLSHKQYCDTNSNLIPLGPFAYNREEVHEVSESDPS